MILLILVVLPRASIRRTNQYFIFFFLCLGEYIRKYSFLESFLYVHNW